MRFVASGIRLVPGGQADPCPDQSGLSGLWCATAHCFDPSPGASAGVHRNGDCNWDPTEGFWQ